MKNLTPILIIFLLFLIPSASFSQSSKSFLSSYVGRWEGYADSLEGSLVVNMEIKNGIVSGFVDDSIIKGRIDAGNKLFISPLNIKGNKVTPKIDFMSPSRIEGTYRTQADEYKWLLVKSAAHRSDVTISNVKVNEKEPWTGKWKVESSSQGGGIWAMKQEGNTVKSTRDSSYDFKGKVQGNQLKGKIANVSGSYNPFTIEMLSDDMTFKGTVDMGTSRTNHLKGRRIE